MHTRKNNILITGVNGFIGSSLADYIDREHKPWVVYGIDRKQGKPGSRIFDISNKGKLAALLTKIKPRYIFHFSGTTQQFDFNTLLSSNVYATHILFEAIRSIKRYKPRVFIPGSAAEYGEVSPLQIPIKENCPLRPISLYGFSKMAQEALAVFYASQGLNIVVGRIFNIMGKGAPVHSAIGKFAYELALIRKKKKKPVLYSKGLNSKRDFLDINDLCKYIVHIAKHAENGGVYNICRGKSYRIEDLLKKLIEISGIKNITIISEGSQENNTEISDSFGSTRKLNAIFKLSHQPIEKSLSDAYLYYLDKR